MASRVNGSIQGIGNKTESQKKIIKIINTAVLSFLIPVSQEVKGNRR